MQQASADLRFERTAVSGRHAAAPASDDGIVARRTRVSEAEFRETYLLPRRPVILADAASAWPVYGKGTPDYFRRRHGDHPVRVLGEDWRLADLIDRLEASTFDKPGPYPCKFEIARDVRELLDDVSPRFAYSLPDRQSSALVPRLLFRDVNNLEIFFGGPGGKFPYLHYDIMRLHAWITQLHGDKEFTLYAPDQEPYLYVNPDVPWQSRIRNHHNPDFSRYPLLRQARAHKVVIHPGDTLFLPCGWWHTARSLTLTISVAFDQLGPDNWRDFSIDAVDRERRERHRLRAAWLGAYLRLIDPVLGAIERLGGNRPRQWPSR